MPKAQITVDQLVSMMGQWLSQQDWQKPQSTEAWAEVAELVLDTMLDLTERLPEEDD